IRARGRERRLRAHRTREGRLEADHPQPLRAAERHAAGGHHDRSPDRPADLRCGADRDRVRLPGHRSVPGQRHLRERLPGAAGLRALHRRRLRPDQPARRHLLQHHRPESEDPVSATEVLQPPTGPEDGEDAPRRSGSFWGDVFRRVRKNPAAWVGAIVVLAFILVAALAPWLAPYAELATPGREHLRPTALPGPGDLSEFPLGIDRFGGDVLSKLIWGAQASLLIGIISTFFGLVGGMVLGALAG